MKKTIDKGKGRKERADSYEKDRKRSKQEREGREAYRAYVDTYAILEALVNGHKGNELVTSTEVLVDTALKYIIEELH